jgi:hypothetical protein
MSDRIDNISETLQALGLPSTGGARDENFYVMAAHISGDAISRIEETMGGEMPSELKELVHLVIERSAHLTGPQPSFGL